MCPLNLFELYFPIKNFDFLNLFELYFPIKNHDFLISIVFRQLIVLVWCPFLQFLKNNLNILILLVVNCGAEKFAYTLEIFLKN